MMFTVYRGPELRAAYLDAVTRTWPGWQVRWAFNGLADLIDHLGGDISQIRRDTSEPETLYWGDRTERMHLRYVVTVGDTLGYGLAWNANDPWLVWAGLLEQTASRRPDHHRRDDARGGHAPGTDHPYSRRVERRAATARSRRVLATAVARMDAATLG
jgi:hypothetical protein